MLRRRGAGPDEIDDIIQDAALRLLEASPRYDSADDLWPWASTVAGHLWIDRLRRRRFTDPLDHAVPADTDIALEVESRLALLSTLAAIQELRAPDRAAIRRAVAAAWLSETSVLEDQRRRVELHRARHRLRLRLEGLIALLVTAWLRARSRAAGRGTAAALTAGAAALAVSVLVLPNAPGRPDTGPAPAARGEQLVTRAPSATAPDAVRPADQAPPAPPPAGPPAATGSAHRPGPSTPGGAGGPTAGLAYPTPLGTGRVGARPHREQPVACAYAGALGRHCVDPPVTVPPPDLPPVPLPSP